MRNASDAAKRQLNMQMRGATSVGAVATAALEQGSMEFVCVRVKDDPKDLIPRCGLVSESFTTYLDIAKPALCSSSAEDWEKLQSYP